MISTQAESLGQLASELDECVNYNEDISCQINELRLKLSGINSDMQNAHDKDAISHRVYAHDKDAISHRVDMIVSEYAAELRSDLAITEKNLIEQRQSRLRERCGDGGYSCWYNDTETSTMTQKQRDAELYDLVIPQRVQ